MTARLILDPGKGFIWKMAKFLGPAARLDVAGDLNQWFSGHAQWHCIPNKKPSPLFPEMGGKHHPQLVGLSLGLPNDEFGVVSELLNFYSKSKLGEASA